MTKDELAERVARKTGVDKRTVVEVIKSFTEVVAEKVASGEAVTIRGFGTFTPHEQKARKARDIKNNITIDLPAQRVPKFVPAKEFKKQVREAGDIADHLNNQSF